MLCAIGAVLTVMAAILWYAGGGQRRWEQGIDRLDPFAKPPPIPHRVAVEMLMNGEDPAALDQAWMEQRSALRGCGWMMVVCFWIAIAAAIAAAI